MQNEFNALKRFGQNFLIDKNILDLMLERSNVCKNDCVLEIGPGHGILTRALLEKGAKCVHAVELDERLRSELEELSGLESEGRLILHWADAVKFDYDLLKPFPNKIIANIPYNITTPLIWKLVKFAKYGLKYHLYMLQKESAERITAPPDTKLRYPLGITVEAMGNAEIVKNVSRSCFRPVPKVDSAIVEIRIEKNFELACDPLWSELLHRSFAHRRKTLINNLRGFMNIQEWEEILHDCKKMRAEDLSCVEWLKIYEKVKYINL